MVGANYAQDDKSRSEYEVMMHPYENTTLRRQEQCISDVKQARDNDKMAAALAALKIATDGDANLMEPITEAVRCYATVGEICQTLKESFGSYKAPTGI